MNPKTLIISSCSLKSGPAVIAGQYYDALRKKGIDVDLMLKYPDQERPEALFVVKEGYDNKWIVRLKRRFQRMIAGVKKINPTNAFFYTKEIYPPVPASKVVSAIKKKYDLVIIVFWQEMLSFETIQRIYDKLHCQIQFLCVDYSHMSGGCHFVGLCERYKVGCGMCPGVYSRKDKDFTAWNVQFRKKVYDRVKPVVFGNHHMQEFYKESFLLRNSRVETFHSMIIDTEEFKPLERTVMKDKLGILPVKKSVIFFACQNLDDERKGIKYLLEALNILHNKISDKADEVLVIMAGKDFEKVSSMIPFDSKGFGYVAMDKLPELYSASTVFVCPSVNDAGPMMVGQSLCCGTPVVGFDMGSVKDLVKDKGTGICVPLRDSKALAKGIETMIKMPQTEYNNISARCREVAMKYCSYDAQADMILNAYYKYNYECE